MLVALFTVVFFAGSICANASTGQKIKKSKEMALEQFNNPKVDIGFSVAGQADLGLLDAAKNTKKYAIGADSDMSMQF